MLKFTLADNPDGPEIEIPVDKIVRIRRSLRGEIGKTRIDWIDWAYVQEDPATVSKAVLAEYPKLAQVNGPDDSPVWFIAQNAVGPIRLQANHKSDGVNSSLLIGGARQFVRQSHQDVAKIISSDPGSVLPIPNESLPGNFKDILMSIPGQGDRPIEDWEEPSAYFDAPES